MKKLTKIISAILTAAMLLALLPAGMIVRAESGTCGDNLTWTLEDGVLTISGTGQMEDYFIWEDYPAPWGRAVKSVIISEGVTSIGCYAFYGCAELTSISIPDSLKNIYSYAFYGCTGLTDTALHEGVQTIEYGAFSGCTGLTSVVIPDSVVWLGDELFFGCTGLTSVSIGSGLESAGGAMFAECPNLETITIAENNPNYHVSGNCLIDTRYKSLIAGCKNSVIPADGSVRSISEATFQGCTGLTSVSIPEGVVNIGQLAFSGCTGLTSAEILDTSDTLLFIGAWAFENCSNLKSITILSRNTGIGDEAFVSWKDEDGDGEREAYYPTTLRVYEGSRAHNYAINNGVPFVLIGAVTKGDPDGDGETTVSDALAALRVAAKLAEPTETLLAACDIDGDGVITVSDALAILRVAAKLATPSSLDGGHAATLAEIVVTKLPKTTYRIGEALDVTGGEITVYYSDNTSETVAMTAADMVSGFDSSAAGTHTLTVTYHGKRDTFVITVLENNTVLSIVVTKPPKTLYRIGEALDVTGGEITVFYGDNFSDTVAMTAADMVSGFDSSTAGTYTLTVTYHGKKATFNITVVENNTAALRIVVVNLPKTAYKVSDELDVSGGTIMAIYDGWNERLPMTVDMVSGFDNSIVGTQVLTVSYGGATTTYNVTVKDPAAKVTVSVETVEAAPGAKGVEVKIIVNAASKWNWVSMQLFFDPAGLIYKGYETNPVLNDEINAGEKINFYMDDTTAKNGTITTSLSSKKEEGNNYEYLFVMKFDIPSGASGFKHIVVDVAALKDRENTDVPFVAVNGGITVA
ncbi:MAG: leucine-rich repeat protein [Clostridia bacterium]|nr:leucine-rich repeat protein [Clostridia bacterium]